MAVAVAICKCNKCGKLFSVRKKDFKNRAEANNWKEWKESNCDLCETCENEIANERIKEKMKGYSVCEVHYSVYKNYFSDAQKIYDSYNQKTKTIKIYLDRNQVGELKSITNDYKIIETIK